VNVLVVVTSKHGATMEIAEAIGARLRVHGMYAQVSPPEDVDTLVGFDAVLVGSAVYAGRWLAPSIELVRHLRDELLGLPVWLFSSGPVGDPPRPEEDPIDVAELFEMVSAPGHRVFPGFIDPDGLRFGERAIVRALHASTGDYRDWVAVNDWADEVASALGAPPLAIAEVGEVRPL
jgi:menaquinone-dependent protoporphyrinogen oxidase